MRTGTGAEGASAAAISQARARLATLVIMLTKDTEPRILMAKITLHKVSVMGQTPMMGTLLLIGSDNAFS